MTNHHTWLRWFLLPALLLAAGCNAAYHRYADCRPGCEYCAPAPLPHTFYQDRGCHSCAAGEYLLPAAASRPVVREQAAVKGK